MSKTINTAGGASVGTVRLDDLRSGRRARVNLRECEQLTGRSKASLDKDRVEGRGIPFMKDDENGRIWYSAEAVLAYLAGKQRKSTSEYRTNKHIAQAEHARNAIQASANAVA
jgi:hypothetical protein